MKINIQKKDMSFILPQKIIFLGADSNGRPTISIEKCSAGVSDIDIHFRGGKAWLYNLFRKIVGKRLKKSFGDLVIHFIPSGTITFKNIDILILTVCL